MKLLCVDEVACLSGFGPKAVRNAIKRGELAAHKLCGRWRIFEGDYLAWVERARYVPEPVVIVETSPVVPSAGSLGTLRRIEGEAAA